METSEITRENIADAKPETYYVVDPRYINIDDLMSNSPIVRTYRDPLTGEVPKNAIVPVKRYNEEK